MKTKLLKSLFEDLQPVDAKRETPQTLSADMLKLVTGGSDGSCTCTKGGGCPTRPFDDDYC